MTRSKRRAALRAVLIVAALTTVWLSGCYPFSMGIGTPIPVPAWASTRIEERYYGKNDFRTAILPPVRPGFPEPRCEDPPDDAQVLRTLKQVCRGVPYFYEEFREDIQIVKEQLPGTDKIDPPRFYPLVGPAQLHHCHYKCTVFYTETIESGYPFPFKCVRRRSETVYIDRDHLHLVSCTPEQLLSLTRDLAETNP